MSFSADIKEELSRIRLKQENQKLSLLSGLTQSCGSLRLSHKPQVFYQSELLCVTKYCESLACQLFELNSVFGVKEQEHRLNPLSVVTLSGPGCRQLLLDTGIMRETEDGVTFEKRIPEHVFENEDTQRCFLRGIFLGSGSCTDPASGYHLEMAVQTESFGNEVARMISKSGVTAKCTERKNRYVVYVKGDDVAAFLALIGASGAALNVEDVRAVKDYRNYINRTSNCETANIGKTIRASLQQAEAIAVLEQHMNLNDLPAPLYEAALLRLQNPDASLQELADMAEIGKSGMNHRFTRILEMAREYEDNL